MTDMKPPYERARFILDYLREPAAGPTVDILDSDFVYAYAEANRVAVETQPYGAPRSTTLVRDLSALHRSGHLDRERESDCPVSDGAFPNGCGSTR